jgi:hypothetical protein
MAQSTCPVAGCNRQHNGKQGWFHAHSLAERLSVYIDKTPTCWLWTGHINPKGYAYISSGGRSYRAHRLTYEMAKGPIPEGLELDHLCRVRHCVNPDHLEAVTARVNQLRGEGPQAQHARQTHCIRGHPLSGSNVYYFGLGKRQRMCLTCKRARQRNGRKRGVLPNSA